MFINTWRREVFLIWSNMVLWNKNNWFNILTSYEFVTSRFFLQNSYNSFALRIKTFFSCHISPSISLHNTPKAIRFTSAMTSFKVDTYVSHVSWGKVLHSLHECIQIGCRIHHQTQYPNQYFHELHCSMYVFCHYKITQMLQLINAKWFLHKTPSIFIKTTFFSY